jgi:hypothetical protein
MSMAETPKLTPEQVASVRGELEHTARLALALQRRLALLDEARPRQSDD